MAHSNGSARTAPKGEGDPARATPNGAGRTLFTPTIQWILVAIAGLLVIGAIIYFASDSGSGGDDTNQRGLAPLAVVEEPTTAA